MKVKIGDTLIARKTVKMNYSPEEVCLIKNKKYKIISVNNISNTIAFKSEISSEHNWQINDLNRIFINSNHVLNKDIHIL